MVNKATLRKVYLEKRMMLSDNELRFRNERLIKRLLDYVTEKHILCIHSFLPISKNKEVDTYPFLAQFKADPRHKVIIARTRPQRELEHYYYDEATQIRINTWGIPEPVSGNRLNSLGEIDAVLVPLITFDKQGHRIGYGGGYYDKFLAQIPNVLTIGLSLAPPLDVIPYSEPHDMVLDVCITPDRRYRF